MKSIVLSLGGSVLLSDNQDHDYFQKLIHLLHHISTQYKLYMVVGGGNIARKYIRLGRHLDFNESRLDTLGIEITRVNAKLLTYLLDKTNTVIPSTTDEAKKMKTQIVVMGGTTPGHSTDMVGAELAEKVNAERFIIATNVDGIYDNDPKRYHNAKQLPTVSIDQLIKRYGTSWDSAGKHTVIDGPALKIIKRAKLTTYVVNGARLHQLENALLGRDFNGSKITV